jgi:hypothetical protein
MTSAAITEPNASSATRTRGETFHIGGTSLLVAIDDQAPEKTHEFAFVVNTVNNGRGWD